MAWTKPQSSFYTLCLWFQQCFSNSAWTDITQNLICAVLTSGMSGRRHSLLARGTMNTSSCLSGCSIAQQCSMPSSMMSSETCWITGSSYILTNTYENHVEHVWTILQCLITHQLYAKAEKCEFHQTLISFLGYVISPESIAMEYNKIRAVLKWPQPTMIKVRQQFLGFANVYRWFIRGFNTVATPLTSMIMKGDSQLSWNPSAIKSFQDHKAHFTSAPWPGAAFSYHQGAPSKCIPCAYFSHKLFAAKQNYDVGDWELLAFEE